jgi:hypothetical protein
VVFACVRSAAERLQLLGGGGRLLERFRAGVALSAQPRGGAVVLDLVRDLEPVVEQHDLVRVTDGPQLLVLVGGGSP